MTRRTAAGLDREPGTGRVTQNVALEPGDRDALRDLAERYDGGNVSRTVRRLIRREWAADGDRGVQIERRPAPVREAVAS